MRYLARNHDGTVAVIVLVPTGLTEHATGRRHAVAGVRTDPLVVGHPELGELRALYGAFGRLVVGDGRYDIGDLEPDTLPGYTLHFPDVQRDVIAKWIPPKRDAVAAVRPLARAERLTDRTFRDAWTDGPAGLGVDMPRARELHRDHIRVARHRRFKVLDAEVSRALVADDRRAVQAAEAVRQLLRDAPADPAIEAAQTPEALKACWPAELGPMVVPQRPNLARMA